MTQFRLTSAALLLLLLIGCGGPAKQIAGKWKNNARSSEVTWEFFSNGALTRDRTPGRYTFGDNQRIKIETASAKFVYRFEIQGDTMTWTEQDGSRMEFTRLK